MRLSRLSSQCHCRHLDSPATSDSPWKRYVSMNIKICDEKLKYFARRSCEIIQAKNSCVGRWREFDLIFISHCCFSSHQHIVVGSQQKHKISLLQCFMFEKLKTSRRIRGLMEKSENIRRTFNSLLLEAAWLRKKCKKKTKVNSRSFDTTVLFSYLLLLRCLLRSIEEAWERECSEETEKFKKFHQFSQHLADGSASIRKFFLFSLYINNSVTCKIS